MEPELALAALVIAFFATLFLAWQISRRVGFGFMSRRLGQRNWFVRTVRLVFFFALAVILAPITFGVTLGVLAGAGLIGS